MGFVSVWLRFSSLAVFVLHLERALADCQSYGVDYVDGESYFVNTDSTDYFSFVTEFEGCTDEETITPLLVDPNGDEYFCSDIETTPSNVYRQSSCNVTDNEVFKADMFPGTWIIIIEGLTFAWMREFDITTGFQSTTTVTPTSQVTFNITTQSTVREAITSIQTIQATLPPVTVVQPSETASPTVTITPPTLTLTSTLSFIQTVEVPKFTVTEVTETLTAPCNVLQWDPKVDQQCTYLPTKVDLGAKVTSLLGLLPSILLGGRALDAPTVTVTGSPVTETLTSTINLPPTTITVSKIATGVVTQPPVTVFSGIAQSTVTAPTPTRTSYTITTGVITTESTYRATATKYATATASSGYPCFFFDVPLIDLGGLVL